MITLTELRGYKLVDQRGARARLRDLLIDLSTGDYPDITGIYYNQAGGQLLMLPWATVLQLDRRRRSLRVADLGAGEAVSPEALDRAVLLRRDVLDALVLNLETRRAARANDLWLELDGDRLELCGADTSTLAIWQRMTHLRFGQRRGRSVYDWKYVEFLRGDPQAAGAGADYHRRIARLPPGEIARLTDDLPYLHAAELLMILPDQRAADTLEAMTPERQLQVFEELSDERAEHLLALMGPDSAADLLGQLEPEVATRLIDRLPPERGEHVIDLLRYPEDTVGGIMTNEVATIGLQLTVGAALTELRERLRQPDFVHFIFVVDDDAERRLRGVVTLRELLVAEDSQPVTQVMNSYVVTLPALGTAREAAYQVINTQLAALPVVGQHGQLLGAVTVDAALAYAAPPSLRSQVPRVFS